MNEAPSLAEFRSVLEYMPEPGLFLWRVKRNGRLGGVNPGDIAGKVLKTGYVSIGAFRKDWLAHRLAFLFMTRDWPRADVDHIDGDKANNAWANLRDVPHRVNLQNRKSAPSHSKSGLLGVHFNAAERRWIAEITNNGKPVRIGRFQTADDAAEAYLRVKRLLHEGCTI